MTTHWFVLANNLTAFQFCRNIITKWNIFCWFQPYNINQWDYWSKMVIFNHQWNLTLQYELCLTKLDIVIFASGFTLYAFDRMKFDNLGFINQQNKKRLIFRNFRYHDTNIKAFNPSNTASLAMCRGYDNQYDATQR